MLTALGLASLVVAGLLLAWVAASARTARRQAAELSASNARLAEANRRLEEANQRAAKVIAEHERTAAALRSSEEQLRQAQKMEAIGRLAGGVAHDFNNILTAIIAYSEFLLESLGPADARSDDVREIRRAARRAATLTGQLLAFSRRQVRQPRLLALDAVVADLEKILARVITEDVQLVTRPGGPVGSINADPSQVEQIVMNLVVNASDAMPEGGTITLATRDVAVCTALPNAHPLLRHGEYVVLEVADTGVGMDEATRARIFEPFFTTKDAGRGTGLGLATVYAIAEQSGGAVEVETAPGKGSVFRVYFPRAGGTAEAYSSGVLAPTAPGGTETVLFVEDDDAVRSLGARILERYGYTVIQARDGREALEVARRHPEGIQLLLTDVVMPEVNGRRLATQLAAQRPELRVMFISGYTAGEIDRLGQLDEGVAFIPKPFTAQSLLLKVREVLDQAA